jgi:hypothetical protein
MRPATIQKKIDELNALLIQSDFEAIEVDSTWETCYQFKPIKIGKKFVTIRYNDLYDKHIITRERLSFNHEDLKYYLNWVKRCIKKSLKHNEQGE